MGQELAGMKRRLIWSFVFLIPLFYISMGHMMGAPLPAFLLGHGNAVAFGLTQLLLTLPIMYINDKYYKVGFKTLWNRAPNMDSLIAVGSAAAVIYGVFAIYQMGYGLGHGDMDLVAKYHMDLYFESAGMILTLITLGKFLETRSKGKTGEAISRLMDLAPKTATVLREGAEVEIPVEEVQVGDSPPWTNPPSPANLSLWTRGRGTRWPPPPSTSRASSPLRPAGWGRTPLWPR